MSRMRTLAALGLGGSLSVGSAAASAAGFLIAEQSVKGLGNAFAGWAASAEDASTLFYNPAGLTRLNRELLVGVNVIMPSTKFENDNSQTRRDSLAANGASAFETNTLGGNGGDAGVTIAVPNLYYAGSINKDLKWGIGVFSPFGLSTSYDSDWVGRYLAIRSDIRTYNINPAIAYRVPHTGLSLALGVSAQYADAKLTKAVDVGAAAGGAAQAGTLDATQELKGDDWAFGYNAGLLFEFNPHTRVGLQYRSRIDHRLSGNVTVTYNPLTGRPDTKTSAKADLDLPDIASASIYHQFTGVPVAVMADATWTGWGRLDQVDIHTDMGDSALVLDYQDTWRYAAGLTINPQETWRVRAGLAYDESPVKGAQTRSPRLPDNDRTWLTLGFGWDPTKEITLDLAYAHLIFARTLIDISDTDAFGTTHTLNGSYDSDVDIVSAQLTWKF
jgi:long-chain fatty acid transport protein